MAHANLKLLGDALRTFREQAQPKRISQFRLAALMNWEGTAPIIEIEKGRRHPRPETLNALGEALQLSPADIAYLHGLAGYRALTVMPPVQQIKRVLQAIEPEIAQYRYPVYVMDYRFRFWMMNSATAAFQGGSLEQTYTMMRLGIDGFRMSFDSRILGSHEDVGSGYAEAMEREALFRFKSYNLYRRYEPFYLAYPACMQAHLLPEDYARFVQRWNDVDVRMQDVYPILPRLFTQVAGAVLAFDVHMVEIVHLDRLMFVAYHEPTSDDSGNRERCEAFFDQNRPSEKRCVCAWDYWEHGPPTIDERQ
jgi:hypothetical protein